jgi:hypothetical protein
VSTKKEYSFDIDLAALVPKIEHHVVSVPPGGFITFWVDTHRPLSTSEKQALHNLIPQYPKPNLSPPYGFTAKEALNVKTPLFRNFWTCSF